MITHKHITKFIISKQITLIQLSSTKISTYMSAKQKQSKGITMQAIKDITQGISIHTEYVGVFFFYRPREITLVKSNFQYFVSLG
jgi:hypothetical protein